MLAAFNIERFCPNLRVLGPVAEGESAACLFEISRGVDKMIFARPCSIGKSRILQQTCLLIGALLWCAQVQAQESRSSRSEPTSADGQDVNPGAYTTPFTPFGQYLAAKGIYIRGFLDEEIAANPVGGLKQGSAASQYAVGGVDLDLQQMFGLTGARIHAYTIDETSRGLSAKDIGGGIDVQENYAPFSLFRFLELSYDQSFSIFAKNDFNLVGGRIGITSYFAKSDYACQFMSHVFCGPIYGLSQDTGTALAPLATWGGRASFNITPKIYAQGGVFAIDNALFSQGTTILNFDTNKIIGENYVGEIGYKTDFTDDLMPRHYRLGAWVNEAPRNDAYLNTNGQPYALFGGTQLTHTGEGGMYVMGDQVVSRPDPNSRRNIALFGSFLTDFSNTDPVKYAGKFGVVKTGTFEGRKNDTIGLAFSDTVFSSAEIAYLSQLRRIGGGFGTVANNEYTIEAMYGYALAPGVIVRPDIQYVINPYPQYAPTTPRPIPNALVAGVQITVNIPDALGMPKLEAR
jgi:porin